MTRKTCAAALLLALAVPQTFAAQLPAVPVDQARQERAIERLRDADARRDFATVMLEGQRAVELFPNDPLVQAVLYEAVAGAAARTGDAARAARFDALAQSLDPRLAARLDASAPPAMRGDKLDKLAAALSVLGATVTAVRDAREQMRASRAAPAPAPNYPPPMAGPAPAFPDMPVGMAGYQPAAAPPMPMPGYGPPPAAPGAYGAPPPAYAQPAGYAPAGYPPQYPPPPDYYRVPAGYAPGPAVRGERVAPIRVRHDHSRVGDAAYFADGCGALLAVDGMNLTFTATGGEAPRAIPFDEIVEIKLNETVGVELGAFHITTAKGLYLHLAPPSGKPDDARAMIETLSKRIGR